MRSATSKQVPHRICSLRVNMDAQISRLDKRKNQGIRFRLSSTDTGGIPAAKPLLSALIDAFARMAYPVFVGCTPSSEYGPPHHLCYGD